MALDVGAPMWVLSQYRMNPRTTGCGSAHSTYVGPLTVPVWVRSQYLCGSAHSTA